MDKASASSTIFITCRKRTEEQEAFWIGLGGSGVRREVREAVATALSEFAHLRLKPVDEMIACYGRALMALSTRWPVLGADGNPISTREAMNEASAVVAAHQLSKLSKGRLRVEDLDAETALCAILSDLHGVDEVSFDEASTITKALGFSFKRVAEDGGYRQVASEVGLGNATSSGRGGKAVSGAFAPLAISKSRIRLLAPEERAKERMNSPQTDWDVMHGLILAFRKGDMVVARAYLENHAPSALAKMVDLLRVWASGLPDGKPRKEADALLFGLRNMLSAASSIAA
jgi:adenine-specific DNA methylase